MRRLYVSPNKLRGGGNNRPTDRLSVTTAQAHHLTPALRLALKARNNGSYLTAALTTHCTKTKVVQHSPAALLRHLAATDCRRQLFAPHVHTAFAADDSITTRCTHRLLASTFATSLNISHDPCLATATPRYCPEVVSGCRRSTGQSSPKPVEAKYPAVPPGFISPAPPIAITLSLVLWQHREADLNSVSARAQRALVQSHFARIVSPPQGYSNTHYPVLGLRYARRGDCTLHLWNSPELAGRIGTRLLAGLPRESLRSSVHPLRHGKIITSSPRASV
ncbi:unnamed protein product, partial [Iphiclides podalirius]